ncbi:MAG: ABC transporter ATP-binding protein [Clostridia bacterium]|nr:ABC transporter ATP-binding protein [Clostridia bacterium]
MRAIETLHLTKRFKSKTAVEDLNLSIGEGELFSLLGQNGAGKTTTIRMLCGLLPPSGGDALLLGESVVKKPQLVKRWINISPQETAVARNLSVRENLEMIAGIYGHGPAAARSRAGEMLSAFGLTERAEDKARILSGGMQRRLSIAMALISGPRILFLDEPTLGLDVVARRELWAHIERLKGRVTIILTTHYLEEAEALSDRIGVMAEGGLRASGTAAELVKLMGTKNFEDAFVALATGKEAAKCG